MTSYRVTCSCRRKAIIRWAPLLRHGRGRYVTLEPGWSPSMQGWTCGREGHKQLVPPQPLGAKTPQLQKITV
jgi:hypothetical protein